MTKSTKELTPERLREVLHYDPDTGVFTWRSGPAQGRVAGWLETGPRTGYIRIEIDGRAYMAHRLAYLYVTGEWPSRLDHIDNDKTNNRFANLRIATASQNAANRRKPRNNSSGYKGVSFYKKTGKWVAYIRHNYRHKTLGYFDTPEAAHAAYCAAAQRFFGEYAREE